ncbi:MAG: hypothetical protein ACRC0L_05180 [Angustibacter sp.]
MSATAADPHTRPGPSATRSPGDLAQVWVPTLGRNAVPPLLALGISERVGSNWFSDTLRSVMAQHNEPLRQQLAAEHPLSPLHPDPPNLHDASLNGLARHWVATFVVSKYGPERQLIKETNLFFTTETLLGLFPDSSVVVLSRSPLGIVSSFSAGGLWHRWSYRNRYHQLVAMARHRRYRAWAALVPHDDPDPLLGVTRMVILNALLLSQSLGEREHHHFPYERQVHEHARVIEDLCQLIPESPRPLDRPRSGRAIATDVADCLFTTRKPTASLRASLSTAQAQRVYEHSEKTLGLAADLCPAPVISRARLWLGGAEQYHLTNPTTSHYKTAHLPIKNAQVPSGTHHLACHYVSCEGLYWRNFLVTNAELAHWLNDLHAAGMANTHQGTHLLVTVMPHGRGGRIHLDSTTGRWAPSPGFCHHPASWVTWIGAAAFALSAGARLPTRQEIQQISHTANPTNTDYLIGDLVPVQEPHLTDQDIHHRVGNVQIWCADGPPPTPTGPLQRYLFGAAWNTPDTPADINAVRSRHLLGSSRGVGIRLVQDPAPTEKMDPAAVAALLAQWLTDLDHFPDEPLAVLDQRLIDTLTPTHGRELQTNGRLSSLVGTGTRESPTTQINKPIVEPQGR